MNDTNLTLIRGDDAVLDVAAVTSAGAALDLTGYALTFTAKYCASPFEPAILGPLTIGSGIAIVSLGGGTATVTIPASAWTAYIDEDDDLVWDLQATLAGVITTLARGRIRVVLDVTR